MMDSLIEDAGRFRSGSVDVFNGDYSVLMASPRALKGLNDGLIFNQL